MSREAWGDPPERQEPPQLCPVCDSEYHAEDCELGQEVARRLKAEAERDAAVAAEGERWRELLRECEPLLADMTGPHWPARVEVLRRVQAALRAET